MKIKAFLKINRQDASGVLCLRYWLEVFREYPTFILCDWFQPGVDPVPGILQSVKIDYPRAEIINSDRNLTEYCGTLKGAKHGMATANLTGFVRSQDADAFWMIDADDTMFLTRRFEIVQEKLRSAEEIMFRDSYDGFSLDFYRNLNDGWTFGVALLRSSCPWKRIQEVQGPDMVDLGYARNIDSAFHVLGKRGVMKLGNFVFSGMAFQHLHNNYPDMPEGVYYWPKAHLWDRPLQPDVIVI